MSEEAKVEVTGDLKNWFKQEYTGGSFIIWGDIYNDIRQRWWEGAHIHTSSVVKIEGDLVYTLNSVYRCKPEDEWKRP